MSFMITGQQSPSDQLPFCSSELPWGERECKPTMLSSLINYITRMNLQTFPRVAVWAPNDSSGLAEFCSLWHLQLVIRSHKSGGGGSSSSKESVKGLNGRRSPAGFIIQTVRLRVGGRLAASNPGGSRISVRSSLVSQWIKDLALSLQWLRSLLWCRFNPWPWKFFQTEERGEQSGGENHPQATLDRKSVV